MAVRSIDRPETRKLQVVGGSTFAVTLPKAWVETLGLTAGDEVELRARPDGAILVAPRNRPNVRRRRELDVSGDSAASLLRRLIALYLHGDEEMVLRTGRPLSPALRRSLDEACTRLPGLQIVDEGPTTVSLCDLADAAHLDMGKAVRLMHLNARRMLKLADELLSDASGTPPSVAELERCEADLDRMLLLLIKQHNTLLRDLRFGEHAGVAVHESLPHLLAAHYLERVGDYAQRVANDARTLTPQERVGIVAARLHEALREAGAFLDAAVASFQGNDEATANGVIDGARAFSERTRERSLELLGAPHAPAGLSGQRLFLGYFSIMESAERVALYAKSIAEVAINKALAAPT